MKKNISLLILVASLGYFVDIYDLILYNIVKKESLSSLGIPVDKETFLFNWQMLGMLLGGLLWGIWGDRKGRVSVLFGSILLYSIANIANAFVTNFEQYAFWRFIAGVGLAGELGAAITLVSESMPRTKRGIGTMVIVTVGALGAVAAFLVARQGQVLAGFFESVFGIAMQNWQISYIVGGILGLLLLALRAGTFESTMFNATKQNTKNRGNFFSLFKDKNNFSKYLACILIGLPVWYVIGILMALSHKFIPLMGMAPGYENIDPKGLTADLIMFSYIGLSVGDLISGSLSQLLRSRKKVIFLNLMGIIALTLIYLFAKNVSPNYLKFLSFLLGAVTGYWALFVTNASEQFGTNIRSTVTATVPNFVRGCVIPINFGFMYFSDFNLFGLGPIGGALIVGGICMALALWGTWRIEESFEKELDYVE